MTKKYYAAYGSNLNIAAMRRRCPEAEIAGTAELKNAGGRRYSSRHLGGNGTG